MPLMKMGAAQDKLPCDPVAIEKAEESFATLDKTVQQEIQKLASLESRELYRILQTQLDKKACDPMASVSASAETRDHRAGASSAEVEHNSTDQTTIVQEDRQGHLAGGKAAEHGSGPASAGHQQSMICPEGVSESPTASSLSPVSRCDVGRSNEPRHSVSPAPERVYSPMAQAPKKRLLEAAGYRSRSSSLSMPDMRQKVAAANTSVQQEVESPSHPSFVVGQGKEAVEQTLHDQHRSKKMVLLEPPPTQEQRVIPALALQAVTQPHGTLPGSESVTQQRTLLSQPVSHEHQHCKTEDCASLDRSSDQLRTVQFSRRDNNSSDGRPKVLNIRTCIESIMESALVRSTLQEQNDMLPDKKFSNTAGANNCSKKDLDEDSNCPLQPHDIQQQMRRVLNSDIEQSDKNKQAAMGVASNRENMTHMMTPHLVAQVPHRVNTAGPHSWEKSNPPQLSLHEPHMVPLPMIDTVRVPPPLVRPDGSLLPTVPYMKPPLQSAMPVVIDVPHARSTYVNAQRLPTSQAGAPRLQLQAPPQVHPHQQQSAVHAIQPEHGVPPPRMVRDAISQGHVLPQAVPVHVQGDIARQMHLLPDTQGVPLHMYPIPLVPGTHMRLPDRMMVEGSVATQLKQSSQSVHAQSHPEAIFSRAPMPPRIAVVRPGTVIPGEPHQVQPQQVHHHAKATAKVDSVTSNQPNMAALSVAMAVPRPSLRHPVSQPPLQFPHQMSLPYGVHNQSQKTVYTPNVIDQTSVSRPLPVEGVPRPPIPVGIAPPEQRHEIPKSHTEAISAPITGKRHPAESSGADAPLDLSIKVTNNTGNQDRPVAKFSPHIQGLHQAMERHTDGVTSHPTGMMATSTQSKSTPPVSSVSHVVTTPEQGDAHPVMAVSGQHASPMMLTTHLGPPPPLVTKPMQPPKDPPSGKARSSSVPTPSATDQPAPVEHRSVSHESILVHHSVQDKKPTGSPSPTPLKNSATSILGNHPLNDILFLKCGLCTSTYGSLHSFKKHFSKAHGGEPSKSDVTIQSISATRRQLELDSYHERQAALRDLNLLPSNRYYESQIARYKTTDGESLGTSLLYHGKEETEPAAQANGYTPSQEHTKVSPVAMKDVDIKVPSVKTVKEENEHKSMQCGQCGQEFPTRDWGVFRRHVKAHEQPGDGQLRCSVCRQCFHDENKYRLHVTSCHVMQAVQCSQCPGIAFSHPSDLDKHMHKVHHFTPGIECKCKHCVKGQTFAPTKVTSSLHEEQKRTPSSPLQSSNLQKGPQVPASHTGSNVHSSTVRDHNTIVSSQKSSNPGKRDFISVADIVHMHIQEEHHRAMMTDGKTHMSEQNLHWNARPDILGGHRMIGLGVPQTSNSITPSNYPPHSMHHAHSASNLQHTVTATHPYPAVPGTTPITGTSHIPPRPQASNLDNYNRQMSSGIACQGTPGSCEQNNYVQSANQLHQPSRSGDPGPPSTGISSWGQRPVPSECTLEHHVHAQLHLHMQQEVTRGALSKPNESSICKEKNSFQIIPSKCQSEKVKKDPPRNARKMFDDMVENVLIKEKEKKSDEEGKLALALTGRLHMEYNSPSLHPTSVPKEVTAVDDESTVRSKNMPKHCSVGDSGQNQDNWAEKIGRPGNVRDIIESLVTAELMHSSDSESSSNPDSTHATSKAFKHLYGLYKTGEIDLKVTHDAEGNGQHDDQKSASNISSASPNSRQDNLMDPMDVKSDSTDEAVSKKDPSSPSLVLHSPGDVVDRIDRIPSNDSDSGVSSPNEETLMTPNGIHEDLSSNSHRITNSKSVSKNKSPEDISYSPKLSTCSSPHVQSDHLSQTGIYTVTSTNTQSVNSVPEPSSHLASLARLANGPTSVGSSQCSTPEPNHGDYNGNILSPSSKSGLHLISKHETSPNISGTLKRKYPMCGDTQDDTSDKKIRF